MSYTVEGYLNGTACLPPVQSAEARRALFTPARLREFLIINLILRILLLLRYCSWQSINHFIHTTVGLAFRATPRLPGSS